MDELMTRLQNKLRHKLSERRMEHSIGVMYTAANLAMAYQGNVYQAQLAGLLHDCAKRMEDDEFLQYCKEHSIPVTKEEEMFPFLLHAKVGEHMAKTKYQINDTNVLQAIRWHTTGKPDMSLLMKIVFVADYVEPNRKMIPGLQAIRDNLYRDYGSTPEEHLNTTVATILENTIRFLQKKNQTREASMDSHTLNAFEYYKEWSK